MSIRDTIRDDPTARRLLQVTTIAVTLGMALPGLFTLFVTAKADDLPEFAEFIIDHILPFFRTAPGDMVSILLGAAPAVVAGVCYTSQGAYRRLNTVGLICAVIAVIGFASSLLGITVLRSDYFSSTDIGGDKAVHHLTASVEVGVRSSLFYLAMFFGIGGASHD